jgi:hypothetical protein
MTIAAAFFIAALALFGVLALPYNLILTGIAWLMGVGLLLLTVRRRAELLKVVGAVAVFCAAGVSGWAFVLMPWVNQPVVSEVTSFNPQGETGRALVIYHPGRSDLQERAVRGFVEGLVTAGWRVDLTTASEQAPAPTGYDLLVLGAQSYTWAPARPVEAYLRRAGDLDGLPVVAILSGLGETGPANAVMRDLIAEAKGSLIALHNVWQLRPMDDLYGTDDPFTAMHGVAQALQWPDSE